MTHSLSNKKPNYSTLSQEVQNADAFLSKHSKLISIFGSARLKTNDPIYKKTVELAYTLAQRNYTILTGGGPGVMQAGNHGASLASKKSLGLNLRLDHEQCDNPYLTDSLLFEHFAARKLAFACYSEAFIVMEGGFGTLDELFTTVVLRNTHKIEQKPIILYGSEFWGGLLDWIQTNLLHKGYINQTEWNQLWVCDTPEEVLKKLDEKKHLMPKASK